MRRARTRLGGTAFVVACVALVAGCGGSSDRRPAESRSTAPIRRQTTSTTTTTVAPATSAAPTPALALSDVGVRLTRVARLDQPTAMAVRPGDDALYVAEKSGAVRVIRNGRVERAAAVDLSGEVSNGGEQGLLGLAFSTDGAQLYLDYTDTSGDTHIADVTLADGRRRDVLVVKQPFPNHNGGQLVVRADGTLWIALGDGGSGGDPQGNGQNLGALLGKILRIDPTPSTGRSYGIPPDNPFVSRPGARPEIWAYGLRNPWRFSFDRQTGDLWIGDVGQDDWEEVDFEAAGAGGGRNYGWNRTEGDHPFDGGTPPPGWVRPVLDYPTGNGTCAVVGGFVYRGTHIPALTGAYLYSDACAGRVLALRAVDGRVVERASLDLNVSVISSFGEDRAGELYGLSLSGDVFRLDPR